ncbi:Eco29kI family restriction endonuclease [Arthrospira platensis]|uniref:Restriction endonuclease n=1 Tax=Limnospira platensis NIES-46 TaxID=1236695 RepID=A0A5M3TE16_LIMPL|nr:Eco29kI family restriction endonuclease [Arthrospira platensis]AMW27032.1 restriction endonuclease [Arthrospira platensis YZ]KDR54706.1 restriction endonuclease [Arthrospira platensis str. Paraca]MBD2670935.1 Eco29kI family restriction endonuclease [Arthrospira platensis FACHB-439]MBD2711695.1 Eco29kI family restriction endonuclease [Arthrospira platensis FACHB-835]MDF2211540.1 Eco29kI family restriction endonuclease [Arthrospira platensis NCB002]MDT9184796.1 Eco29kI family restriction end
MNSCDRSKHLYIYPDFDEIIKDTIRFFNGTPVHPISIQYRFPGTGVYAIYCIRKTEIYSRFYLINRTAFRAPIYVGKEVPKGWRKAMQSFSVNSQGYELNNRIREHSRSINLGEGLEPSDFFCRFMILEGKESDFIGTVEAALIRIYQQIWNTLIDGFGNHDPGKGRYKQAKSDWDVCHPGRSWADKCQGIHADKKQLLQSIEIFMSGLSVEDV